MLDQFSADTARHGSYKLNQLKIELMKVLGVGFEVSVYTSGLVMNLRCQ